MLHRNTDGNPLFLVNTIDDLIGQGQLREVDGQWRLSGPAEDIASRAPETALAAGREAGGAPDGGRAGGAGGGQRGGRGVLGGGRRSRPASIPQQGELRCEALARRGQFLRAAGIAEWPDGTVAGRYAFIHALYQQVLYGRVSIGERVGLHLRTGECLERGSR